MGHDVVRGGVVDEGGCGAVVALAALLTFLTVFEGEASAAALTGLGAEAARLGCGIPATFFLGAAAFLAAAFLVLGAAAGSSSLAAVVGSSDMMAKVSDGLRVKRERLELGAEGCVR